MTGWVGWAKGRMLWLSLTAWIMALLIVYSAWWRSMNGPAPHEDYYQVMFIEIFPILAGLVSIYGVLPRMEWIDTQAITHPNRRDTIAIIILTMAFALIPAVARWMFTLNPLYTNFIPSSYSAADPTKLEYSLPWRVIWPYVVFIAGVLSLGVLLTGLAGRVFGPILGLLGYLTILCMQGYQVAPAIIPRMYERDAPDILPAASLIVSIAVLIIGLTIFRLSNSGVIRFGGWFRRSN